jgi:antitoxin (DNA-binding transcriptional repressor) of toxin-antitoxin stability system
VITVNIHEAKTTLSALLAAIEERDETVLICRNGKPVAELRAPRADLPPFRSRLTPDPALRGRILYDPVEGATDNEWPAEAR